MSTSQLSVATLRRALKIRTRLDALQRKLQHLLGDEGKSGDGSRLAKPRRKRRMSAAARAKMSAAAKARWRKAKQAGRTGL